MRSTLATALSAFILFISLNEAGEDKKYPKIKSEDINNLRLEIREAIDNSSFPSQGFIISGNQPLIGSI